jgi:hypothetical protein
MCVYGTQSQVGELYWKHADLDHEHACEGKVLLTSVSSKRTEELSYEEVQYTCS